MRVMGTAGHVDHGKSSLVRALTGIDPDRLPEEKARGLTIDLGFAHFTLPNGDRIGIVDVPGHERFVKNMIAGVGAIDFVLFVVSADDGWMPQSSEHYEILRQLGVSHGMVALTKIDLVDPEWVRLVADDIHNRLKDGPLAGCQVFPVDSLSQIGLDELVKGIARVAAEAGRGRNIGRPRLYVDRVFKMTGRGVVVTGTLTEGTLRVGSEVAVAPTGRSARIRELQVHGEKVDMAEPPTRVAVNLTGDGAEVITRGHCITAPNDGDGVDRLVVEVEIWRQSGWPLKSGRDVLFILGTSEVEAVATPFAPSEIAPGAAGLVELRLSRAVKVRWGDRFVLRLPTPAVTVGGGRVLDFGSRRHGVQASAFISRMQKRREHTALAYLETDVAKTGFVSSDNALKESSFSNTEIQESVAALLTSGYLRQIGDYLVANAHVSKWHELLQQRLSREHRERPYVSGLNASELQAALHFPPALFAAFAADLIAQGVLARTGEAYRLPAHSAVIPTEWQNDEERITHAMESSGFAPPLRDELEGKSDHGREIVTFHLARGEWVNVGDGFLLPKSRLDEAQRLISEKCRSDGSVTAAAVRDMLATTRKYAVPLLEYFDRIGFTVRQGDERVLAES